MNDYPNAVKETLSSLISEMAENPMLFVKNPAKILPEIASYPLKK